MMRNLFREIIEIEAPWSKSEVMEAKYFMKK
jgi:hypothetical protein